MFDNYVGIMKFIFSIYGPFGISLIIIGSGFVASFFFPGIGKYIFGNEYLKSLQLYCIILVIGITISIIFWIGFLKRFDLIFGCLNRIDVVVTYLNASITILIGITGVISIIFSLIYGFLFTSYIDVLYEIEWMLQNRLSTWRVNQLTKQKIDIETERQRIKRQGIVWLVLLVYFSVTWFVLIIFPLMIKLNSFN